MKLEEEGFLDEEEQYSDIIIGDDGEPLTKLEVFKLSDEYKNTSSFQPGTYPGVKLQYFWNPVNENINGRCNCNMKCFGKGDGSGDGKCKKITVSIFESGKILITGAINFVQIDEAYNYISNVLKKHQNSLEKRYLI